MHYTLDSEEHVINCLEKKYPGQKVISEPVLLTGEDAVVLTQGNQKAYYFGVLTIGQNTGVIIYCDGSNIEVPENNQIIMAFRYLDVNSPNPSLQFRGFQITID